MARRAARWTRTTYKEVWWLDFSKSRQGEWTQITSRFANMDDFGGRREGACAYDPDTMTFYSWYGRASSSIPDGASRSSGVWRTNLSQLGDPQAPLTWERVVKDNQTMAGKGRRLIPSVYDFANNRLFVLGGRNNLDEYADSWMIYPDVTGAECENLDPYAPFRPVVPTATTAPPTITPGGPTVTPRPTSGAWQPTAPDPSVCPGLDTKVPQVVLDDAMANPDSVQGWMILCNPNLLPSPWNTYRDKLTLQDPGKPYNPLFNSVVWKCGCR